MATRTGPWARRHVDFEDELEALLHVDAAGLTLTPAGRTADLKAARKLMAHRAGLGMVTRHRRTHAGAILNRAVRAGRIGQREDR